MTITITRQDLARFAPRPSGAVRAATWDAYADAIVADLPALADEFGLDEALELQHFMAQIGHESGGFTILWESMHYTAPRICAIFGVGRHSAGVTQDEAARLAGNDEALAERVYGLGNPKKARELGNREPGDGYRYRGFGPMQITGRRDHERLLGGEATVGAALRAALREWDEKRCNELARADDLKTITRRINGGYNGLADRKAMLARAKRVWPRLPGDDKPAPITSMAESTTGNTAIGLGTGGGIGVATEVSGAIAKAAATGEPLTIGALLLALAQSPTFWIGVFTVAGAAYIWLERRRKLVKWGI